MFLRLLLLCLALSQPLAHAAEPMQKFEPDKNVQKMAEAYSLDLVDFAAQHFKITLNWSDESIREVEKIAAALHDDARSSKPTEEQLAPFYKGLGSYIGEVFRKNHGGVWGWVTFNGQRFPGMQREKIGLFWPWGKAQGRLVNGPEDNLWVYYQVALLSPIGAGPERLDPSAPDWEEKSKILLRKE